MAFPLRPVFHRARRPLAVAFVVASLALPGAVPAAATTRSSGSSVTSSSTSAAMTTSTSATPSALTTTTTSTASSTARSMARTVLGWVNDARVRKGLRRLRHWSKLESIAMDRAARMAAAGQCSHSVAGDLGSQLDARDVTAWSEGEDIGVTTYRWGSDAASSLFNAWRNSPEHWAILMSSRYNYVGIGFAYRSSSGATYGSVVATESPDHSAPRRWFVDAWRSGTTVGWSWAGADRLLQTHTSGLHNYDVRYRRDGGSWHRLRSGTTSTSITLRDRARGHTYRIEVRDRDHAGNVASWVGKSISVP